MGFFCHIITLCWILLVFPLHLWGFNSDAITVSEVSSEMKQISSSNINTVFGYSVLRLYSCAEPLYVSLQLSLLMFLLLSLQAEDMYHLIILPLHSSHINKHDSFKQLANF